MSIAPRMKRLCDPSSGKFGQAIYQGGKFGQVVRIRAIPTNPRTADQTLARGILNTQSKGWRALTQNQMAAWNAAALEVMSKSRLGMKGNLSGHQLFVKVNASLLTIGGAAVSAPPAVPEFTALPVSGLEITNTTGTIALKLTTTDSPPDGTMLRVSRPVSAGIFRAPDLNYVGTTDSPVSNKIDITAVYTAKYGVPAVGKKVFVSVNSNINGYEDLPVMFSAVVPASA